MTSVYKKVYVLYESDSKTILTYELDSKLDQLSYAKKKELFVTFYLC